MWYGAPRLKQRQCGTLTWLSRTLTLIEQRVIAGMKLCVSRVCAKFHVQKVQSFQEVWG